MATDHPNTTIEPNDDDTQRDRRDLTRAPMPAVLFRMGWPMVIGIVATMSTALADAYFLGRIGTEELAAISFSFPVVLTLMSLSIGLGAGTASVVSRAIGNGDEARVRRVSTDALTLILLVSVLLAAAGYLLIDPVFRLLGASGRTLDLVGDYMSVFFLGFPLLALMMGTSNLLRASGDAFTVGAVMVGAAVINVVLDPILIFGWGPVPAYGVEGAAWASLIGRLVAGAIMLALVVFRDRLISFRPPPVRRLAASWIEVGKVALPAALGNAVNPFCISIVTAIVAAYGNAAVAAFGTATRIESFVAVPMLALSAAIGPIAGQNFGRGEHDRVIAAHRQSYFFSAAWSLGVALLLFVFAEPLMTLFSSDAEVVDTGALYLTIVPITLAGYGITVVASGGFNAIDRAVTGLGFYLLRSALLYVPLAYLASLFLPRWGLFGGIALANILAGVAIAALSLWLLKTSLSGGKDRSFTDAGRAEPEAAPGE